MGFRLPVIGAYAVFVWLWPAWVSAQVLRGRVIDGGTSAPLPGVVVLLIDSAGNTVTRALTDERGEYRLPAAVAGRYQVRTLRIGYRPSTSARIVPRVQSSSLEQGRLVTQTWRTFRLIPGG